MIFVTVGTQVEPFKRLLKAVDEEIEKGTIKDTVIVQAGCTKYKSDNMIIHDYLPMEVFDEYMDQADLIICHGGVGSILGGLNRKKKVIAVARLKKYKEHVNDHQTQIIDNFIRNLTIIKSPLLHECTLKSGDFLFLRIYEMSTDRRSFRFESCDVSCKKAI